MNNGFGNVLHPAPSAMESFSAFNSLFQKVAVVKTATFLIKRKNQ